MSNKLKKKIESDLIVMVGEKLSAINKLTTKKIQRAIKSFSKNVTKKFFKEVRKQEKSKKKILKNKSKAKVRVNSKTETRRRPGRPRKTK